MGLPAPGPPRRRARHRARRGRGGHVMVVSSTDRGLPRRRGRRERRARSGGSSTSPRTAASRPRCSQRVAAAGYGAICWTVDFPVNGLRHRDTRNGFVMPIGIGASDYVFDPLAHLGRPRLDQGAGARPAGAREGPAHRRGRRARRAGGRRRDRGLEPRRPPARLARPRASTRLPEVVAQVVGPRPGADGRRRPPRHRRAQGARARGERGAGRRVRPSGVWPPTAKPASPACWRSFGPSSRTRWRSRAAARSRRSARALVTPAPLTRGRARRLGTSAHERIRPPHARPAQRRHETPTAQRALAVERGVWTGIGITDHDTFAGLDEASRPAADDGIEIVPGIEFSAEYDGASLHVLGYWVDPAHEPLREELKRLTDTRFRRGEMMIEKLQDAGYDISFDGCGDRRRRPDRASARGPGHGRGRHRRRPRRKPSIGTSPTAASPTCPSTRSTRRRAAPDRRCGRRVRARPPRACGRATARCPTS